MIPFLGGPHDNEPHAVYRIFGDSDRLLYVGRSGNPKSRVNDHKRGASWRAEFRRYELTWHPDKDAAIVAEREAIRDERPAHNRRPGDHSKAEHYEFERRRAQRLQGPQLIPADLGDLC